MKKKKQNAQLSVEDPDVILRARMKPVRKQLQVLLKSIKKVEKGEDTRDDLEAIITAMHVLSSNWSTTLRGVAQKLQRERTRTSAEG